MKKIVLTIFIISLLSFPFVYFSMQQDFENGSMIGYMMMIIFMAMIAFFGKLSNVTVAIIIGNMISALLSFYLIADMTTNSQWEDYFKPLTPMQLFILVSILNIIPQLFAMKLASVMKLKLAYIWEK
ncbi:hypothetical protein [Salipaludibacillus daqingensis]|uniref:hypothetical protein n=1 Tax=Salipaludibacillus daqingensis TaxID=3041001 RepID=UPI00247680F3|nr:hypothetical protein [Salipaludibacillus daqingensis]